MTLREAVRATPLEEHEVVVRIDLVRTRMKIPAISNPSSSFLQALKCPGGLDVILRRWRRGELREKNMSPLHWIETWRSIYGPLQKAFDSLDAQMQAALAVGLVAEDGKMVVPSRYLEVVVAKR
jgi:hypothetical protein